MTPDLKALVEAAGRAAKHWPNLRVALAGNPIAIEACTDFAALASPDAITLLATRPEAAEAENARLRGGLKQVERTLTVPAAEYVPAIRDAWAIITAVLGEDAP